MMPDLPAVLGVLAASYLAGCLPFGLVLARLVGGVDIRKLGSGNVGATNVARFLGKRWFPVILFLDAAKGALPPLFLAPLSGAGPEALPLVQVGCAGAAVAGHVLNAFLGFRGGKGVATTAGALLAMAPLPACAGLAVFAIVLAVFRFISLASVLAAISIPPLAWSLESPREIVGFSFVVAFLILVRHRTNLYRIVTGAEPRLSASNGVTSPPEEPLG